MEEDGESELFIQVREERSMERESPVRLEESTYMFQMTIIKMVKFELSSISPRHEQGLSDMPGNIWILTDSSNAVFIPFCTIWHI